MLVCSWELKTKPKIYLFNFYRVLALCIILWGSINLRTLRKTKIINVKWLFRLLCSIKFHEKQQKSMSWGPFTLKSQHPQGTEERKPLCMFGGITEHRMVEIGRDLRRSSNPTHLLKQGHLEHVTQEGIQVGLNISKERLPNLTGQPFPVLI